jgi:CheY-like chemotaxis protein
VKRIIVCDDEPHIVEGLRHLLRGPDRLIEVARSGKEVLGSIYQEQPDLLIVDVMMPEMSGLEVVATLRASAPTKHLPIIILTAKGQAQDADIARDIWGVTLITKPFNPSSLRELVKLKLEGGVPVAVARGQE